MNKTTDLRPLLRTLPHRFKTTVPNGPDEAPGDLALSSGLTGIEYGLAADGSLEWAWRTIDGTDVEPDEFEETARNLVAAIERGVCKNCGTRGQLQAFASPQPADVHGVEYVACVKCRYCGVIE